MSHTPGPWRVTEHSWCETSIAADSTPNSICLLDINHATEESQEADEAQMAANARLIAAAPALLEALKGLLEFVADKAPIADPRVDAAETAIAKAEGEQSEQPK